MHITIFLADVQGIQAKAGWKVGRSRDLGTARGIPVLVLKPFHSHLGLFLLLPWVPWQFVRLSFHEACMEPQGSFPGPHGTLRFIRAT
jgi:hypothetical protein